MRTDKYHNPILTVEEGKRALLYGHDIEGAAFDDEAEVQKFVENSKKVLGEECWIFEDYLLDRSTRSVEEYHEGRTKRWDIPESYKQTNVKEFLLSKCLTDEEVNRIELEYAMFEERGLEPLLQFLLFIVDYMRENEIVWGVGRGSSVASYSLYLMGVHKVNSLKYDLPIEEFLK
jgi:DNA polymerase III alpha subunit